jgi:hypothetical protein
MKKQQRNAGERTRSEQARKRTKTKQQNERVPSLEWFAHYPQAYPFLNSFLEQ